MKKIRYAPASRVWITGTIVAAGIVFSPFAFPENAVQEPVNLAFTLADTIDRTKAQNSNEEKKRAAESKAAFADAYKVFMHPRCMNCHPSGDAPLQGDKSTIHTMNVQRGPDGKGLFAMKCKNCHQDANLEGEHLPPGIETWHLPTAQRPMVFQGKTPRQLAMGFKDSAFTGFKDIHRLVEHVETDHLVLHSFTYGTRPPLSHKDFVARVKEWIDKGAELPDK
ncbi:hypothetical protein [Flavihumibacter solisilvae]|uniref:hypothetical protein n=1 Tax=Flavihumibacter solisilvae TaxID=1349421 RepID=UPI00068FF18F|nr:hypothetical protein [Flavihumibacter solisilvae]